MAVASRDVTVAGLPALSTGPLASIFAEAPVSLMRAVTPTRITAIAATSDTATIFRWVVRSAVTSEWFMGSLPRSCALVVPTGRVVQTRNADSSLKFHLPVAWAHRKTLRAPRNTPYLVERHGFRPARREGLARSQGRSVP